MYSVSEKGVSNHVGVHLSANHTVNYYSLRKHETEAEYNFMTSW